MFIYNYHTHCHFCDGQDEPEAFVEAALKKGFKTLGFSSHTPIPFESCWNMKADKLEEYISRINSLKEAYKGRIEIYTGLEADYFDGIGKDAFRKYNVDYLIGAVHFFGDIEKNTFYSIEEDDDEFRRTLNTLFDGDIVRLAESYYANVIKMIREHKPDILGHMDLIKKNNANGRYFSEEARWYRDLVREVLKEAASSGTIVEANLRGFTRGYIHDLYPSGWILKECRDMGVPVVISSDAHSPEELDANSGMALSALKKAGHTQQRILENGQWKNVNL